MKPLSSVLFFLMYSCAGYSQQLYFYTPDKLKQLPSSEVYNIRQDSKGYIWFSTVAGLCRYNGNSLKVFDKRNGLPEEACYAVSEDKAGRIWIATSGNRILTFENDSLKEAPFSNLYSSGLKGTIFHNYSLKSFEDTLWINTQSTTYKAGVRSSNYEKIQLEDTSEGLYFIKRDGVLLHIKKEIYVESKPLASKKPVTLFIKYDNKTKAIHIPYKPLSVTDWRVLTASIHGRESFISTGNLLVKIGADFNYEVNELPYQIVALYIDKDEGLWVGTIKGGTYYFPDIRNLQNRIINLKGYSVSGICEDNEKGIWCSTLEKGVFYSRNKSIMSYSDIGLKKKAELFKAVGNSIFAASNENELVEINDSVITKHYLQIDNSDHILTDLLPVADKGWIISGKDIIIRTDDHLKKTAIIGLKAENVNFAAKKLIDIAEKRTFGVQTGALIEIISNTAVFRIKAFPSSCWCLHYPGGNYLFSGCRDGMYKINLKDFSFGKIDDIKGNITNIISVENRGIWVTTRANGIYILDGKQIYNLADSLQLPTNRFFDITEDRFHNIWLGSNAGIIKIHYDADNKPHAAVYNSLDGLPSDEIFNVAVSQHNLYFSTNEGVCSFPLQAKLDNTIEPPVFISGIRTNKRRISLAGSFLELPYSENSLTIQLDLLTFKETDQTFIYKLKGRDNLTHTVKGNVLALNSLGAGEYSLEVYAINSDSIVSKYPAALSIKIKEPFWQTAYFTGAVIALVSLVITLIVRRIINRVRKREAEKTAVNKLIAEYRMAALRAQMNPHFIFNCINSIQRYIITNQAEEAYHYLARFSKLIRLVLGYSEENSITLGQELEIVQLYMELEQLRFENKFTFSIVCPENLDKEAIRVPAMMLQPYIENGIWHGLMNLDKKVRGHISVKAELHDHTLQIVIEDNGVGREISRRISSKTHQSKATGINQKRTETLNILSDTNKAWVVMEDINGADNNVKGTRVTINIPQQIYENE